jgi:hypothetical protein
LAAAGFYPKVDRATLILPQQNRLELGCISALDSNGQTIWLADAHRDGKRFVVEADEKLTAFLELEKAIPSKTNAAKVCVVYQKNMRKIMLLASSALLLGTTVIASDFAADPVDFRNPQQDLIDNVSELLRETNELQSCEKQQEEALQRFLEAGLSLNAAALMAYNQYPCD